MKTVALVLLSFFLVVLATVAISSQTQGAAEISSLKSLLIERLNFTDSDVETLAWSSDGTKIATSGKLDRELQIWSLWDKRKLAAIEKPHTGGRSIGMIGSAVVTSPFGLESGVALTLWDYGSDSTRNISLPPPPLRRRADSFVMNSSGRLALLRTFARLVVFDTKDWATLADLTVRNALFLALSPSGDEVATANADGTTSIYDVRGGRERERVETWPDHAQSIVWSPNGAMIASGEIGATDEPESHKVSIKIADAKTGRTVLETKEDIGRYQIKNLSFSPDSSYLVSTQQDGVLRIWNTKNLDLINELPVGKADFFSFDPSGKLLAVSARNKVLILDWQRVAKRE